MKEENSILMIDYICRSKQDESHRKSVNVMWNMKTPGDGEGTETTTIEAMIALYKKRYK